MRILMWSGPRNLSTAMMRSFGARKDCQIVMDEPFYAAYLQANGADHPMRNEILASMETDPAKISKLCAAEPTKPDTIIYQKHMSHHMLDGFDTSFADDAINVFLLRDPTRVLASYAAKYENVALDDIGFRQQAALFDRLTAKNDSKPIVIDSADITRAPEIALTALCAAIGISFDASMLSWPKGIYATDGIWASHWYHAVADSTGFQTTAEKPLPILPDRLLQIANAALPYYAALKKHALKF